MTKEDRMHEQEEGKLLEHRSCISPNCDSSDALAVYVKDDDTIKNGYCWSCNTYFSAKEMKEGMPLTNQPRKQTYRTEALSETIEDILQLPIAAIPARGISLEAAQHFQIRVSYNEQTGEVDKHYYPYYREDENGGNQLVGFKVRIVSPKDFYAVGRIKKSLPFGWNQVKGRKFLIQVEGEADCAAGYDLLHKAGKGYNIVSVANSRTTKDNLKALLDFEGVTLCYDQDKVGSKKAIDDAKLFEPGQVKIAKWDNFKDANDILLQGDPSVFLHAIWNAKEYRPDGIVRLSQAWDTLFENDSVESIPYPWEGLNDKLYGLRPKELVTLTAGSGCVDADTEYLTPTGWKRIADYNGEIVLQIDIKNGITQYTYPDQYIKLPADKLWHIQTKYGIDQVLSDEHEVVYSTNDLPNQFRKKTLKEIRKIHNRQTTGFRGKIKTSFNVPMNGTPGLFYSNEEIRVMVMFLADGHILTKRNKRAAGRVTLKKERKILRAHQLLKDANISYYTKTRGDYTDFYFTPPNIVKKYESYWWTASPDQLKIIAEECLMWDGNQDNQFYSTIRSDADFIQYVFSTQGKRARLRSTERPDKGHTEHNVYVTDRDLISFRKTATSTPEFKEYPTIDGYKYCFTVSSGALVLRRNGNIFITGNSGKSAICREIQHFMLSQIPPEDNIGILALEENIGRTAWGLMAIEANKPLHIREERVDEDPENFRKYFDSTVGTGRYIAYDHFGSTSGTNLINQIKYMIKAMNCRWIFLDHLSIVVSDMDEAGDERRTIDTIMTKLRQLLEETGASLINVVHLRRPSGDKGHERGIEVSLSHLRGSHSIAQLSDAVIAIERDQQSENKIESNLTLLRVLKNRYAGFVGPAGYLYYDSVTGRLTPVHDKAAFLSEMAEEEF